MNYREDYNENKKNEFNEGEQEKKHCTKCPNNCPEDNLQCERGKEGQEHGGDWHGHGGDWHGHGGDWHGHGGQDHGENWHGRGYHFDKDEYYKAYGHCGEMNWEAGPEDKLSILLNKCGHELYRRIAKEHCHSVSYDILSQEEQEQLIALLEKVLDGWKESVK